jgi:hypothetical protein
MVRLTGTQRMLLHAGSVLRIKTNYEMSVSGLRRPY